MLIIEIVRYVEQHNPIATVQELRAQARKERAIGNRRTAHALEIVAETRRTQVARRAS